MAYKYKEHPSLIYKSVNALKHCSDSALVSWVFFFNKKYLCKLVYILLYLHNKFHNIFTIIDVGECAKAL